MADVNRCRHKKELGDLKEQDPEFYEYLQENDAGLLDFGNDLDLDDEDNEMENSDMDESDDESDENLEVEDYEDDEDNEDNDDLMEAAVVDVDASYFESAFLRAQKSHHGMKQLMAIFSAACNPSFSQSDKMDAPPRSLRYVISSAAVYDLVMTKTVEGAASIFLKTLDVDSSMTEKTSNLENHPRWKKTRNLILSFFKSMLETLSSLVKSVQQGPVSAFLMTQLSDYLVLLSPLPQLAKRVVKMLLVFWSKDMGLAADQFQVRGLAFLRLRQMAIQLPGSMREEIFRNMYLVYARSVKIYQESNRNHLLFLSQCLIELYSLDVHMAYQQAFLYIRQLSLHVRMAMMKKTSESLRQITTWQFLLCYRLWTRMICSFPLEHQLGALAFPMTQIGLALLSLATSWYFLPLRFHLLTCLQEIMVSVHSFFPLLPRILEILEHPDMQGKPTPSTDSRPDLQYLLKFPSEANKKVVYRDAVVEESIHLIRQELEIYRYHPGFPEYVALPGKRIKAWLKNCKPSNWREWMKPVIGILQDYSESVKSKRVTLDPSKLLNLSWEILSPAGGPDGRSRLARLFEQFHANVDQEIVVPKIGEVAPSTRTKGAIVHFADEKKNNQVDSEEDEEDDDVDDSNHETGDSYEEEEDMAKMIGKGKKNKKSSKENNKSIVKKATKKDQQGIKTNKTKGARNEDFDEVNPLDWDEFDN